MSNEDRKAEASGEQPLVKFRDQEFTIPVYDDWPLELHEVMGDGKDDVIVMRAALGPQQWAVVRSMNLKTPDIAELSSAVSKALGFGSVGESPASSD